MTRGGRRPGSGRPRGTGTGRTVKPVMFHLTPETIALIDEHRAPRLSRSQFVELAIIAYAYRSIASGPPAVCWPDVVEVDGVRYHATGKVGRRADTGVACAEYDLGGTRVWLDATGAVHAE